MLPLALSSRIRRALLLATGQTTSYGSGAGVDDGALQIGELHRYSVLTTGQYVGTVNITLNGKTDVHNNACVFDEATGLMWSRTASLSVGPASNGLLPWTTNGSGEGIFPYAAAANLALLAGYSNWRIPNANELGSLCNYTTGIYATAFPVWDKANLYWTSTTRIANTLQGFFVSFGLPAITTGDLKTLTHLVALCRGPL